MVVLEAMAVGRPVLATRVEGVDQALRDGIDGKIVKPGCPQALAAGLRQLLQPGVDLGQLGRSAQRRQRDTFSDLSMCRGTATVYDRLLARRPTISATHLDQPTLVR
jgi:glycosyltransferase involved in cell wall biosynthesis